MAIFSAHAVGNFDSHQSIQISKYCTQHFANAERKYGIPKHLLMAIASTESGRWHKGAGLAIPWPWTMNAAGAGSYYDTMHEAIAAARNKQLSGINSIDVGCMQVNLRHHANAFHSLSEAFDPEKNIDYAASFLRRNFDELRSWRQAVAAYHSRSPERGFQYFSLVRKNWGRVLSYTGGKMDASFAQFADGSTVRKVTGKPAPNLLEVADSKITPKKVSPSVAYRAPRMKVIQVSSAPQRRGDEVLVIRPLSQKSEMSIEASSETVAEEKSPYGVKVSRLGSGGANVTVVANAQNTSGVHRISSRQKGPNFIFD